MAESAVLASGTPPPSGYRERYPWHADTWKTLTRDLARLPHALLLHGQHGLGKEDFAWRLGHTLLCRQPHDDGQACGQCRSCELYAAGTHPDLMRVGLEEEGRQITVDQIRALGGFLALHPHSATRKLVILSPAEAMNLAAANSLLKVLEEPPPASVLVLVTAQPARLPATIRSRCASVAFRAPPRAQALTWLEVQGVAEGESLLALVGDAPLAARALAGSEALALREAVIRDMGALRAGKEDPIACAARWVRADAGIALGWAQGYIVAEIRAGMEKTAVIENNQTIKLLFNYLDTLSKARSFTETPLDQTLLVEGALIDWARLWAAGSR